MSTPAGPRTAAGAVWWLGAQTFCFGLTAALVGVVANAMFLDAYGSERLPLTYIVIGAAGVAVSAGIARASRRYDLVPVVVVFLAATTALFGGAYLVARDGGGSWVSGPLLVVFAVLIELGFVVIGMQAGRVLDIAGIKASMPRIMGGFPIGAVAGGLLAGPLVTWLGRTEALLLPTTVSQAAFAFLVWLTGRRYAALLSRPPSARRRQRRRRLRGVASSPCSPSASSSSSSGTRCSRHWGRSSPTSSSWTAPPPGTPARRTSLASSGSTRR